MQKLPYAILAGTLVLAACSNEAQTDNAMMADSTGVTAQDGTAMTADAPIAEENRVYFALDSAELTDEARQRLDRMASGYTSDGAEGITLAGFTDTTGPRAYNETLSAQRADAVRAYLVEQGIAASAIETEAHGQTDLRVATDDGVAEPANRRVRIELGDES